MVEQLTAPQAERVGREVATWLAARGVTALLDLPLPDDAVEGGYDPRVAELEPGRGHVLQGLLLGAFIPATIMIMSR